VSGPQPRDPTDVHKAERGRAVQEEENNKIKGVDFHAKFFFFFLHVNQSDKVEQLFTFSFFFNLHMYIYVCVCVVFVYAWGDTTRQDNNTQLLPATPRYHI
jgi:hypothetical protein